MSDEPFLTRWTFQFGRKREPKPEEGDAASGNQNNGNVVPNGFSSSENGGAKAELAIYEQFRNQANNCTHSNGGLANGTHNIPQKSLLPPFEDAEMRNLAESLCRDIIRGNPDVKWDSIKGLENAKRLLKEAVVMPIKYPNTSLIRFYQAKNHTAESRQK